MNQSGLLLLNIVATLRARFYSLFSISVAVYPERSEGSHSCTFYSLFSKLKQKTLLLLCVVFIFQGNLNAQQKIDREAVVRRHTIKVNKIDSLSSLSVGNGNFAFTGDATGMQSFPEAYAKGVPLGTQSVWGWHSFPNTENLRIEEAQKVYELEGRKISYTVQAKEPERAKKAVEYFRVNQHRLQLGNIGLEIKKKDGSLATVDDIKNINQQLDLWAGIITSSFTVENVPVKVTTVCHQTQDAVSFRIESALLKANKIHIRFRIPFPNGQWKDVGNNWKDDSSFTSSAQFTPNNGIIACGIDTTDYILNLRWNIPAKLERTIPNYYVVTPQPTSTSFEITCL